MNRLDLGLDPFEGGAHAVAIGPSPGPTEERPVQAEHGGVGQLERLGDVGTVTCRFQPIAPGIERLVAGADTEGELPTGLAGQDRTRRPVDGALAISLDVASEACTDLRTGGPVE